MWTVMYRLGSFIKGARGDVFDGIVVAMEGDEEGAGVSIRGIGFGEGKLEDVVIGRRRWTGAAVNHSCKSRQYLSVYRHPLNNRLTPVSAAISVISASCPPQISS